MKVREALIRGEWKVEPKKSNLTRETRNLSLISDYLSEWYNYKKIFLDESLSDFDSQNIDESLSNFDLQNISEEKVMELIKNKPETSEILSDYVYEIKNFLDINNNSYDIKITLQEDPEDMDFCAFIILIITDYDSFKERFKLEKGIADSLNNLRGILLDSREGDITQILNHISFLVTKNE